VFGNGSGRGDVGHVDDPKAGMPDRGPHFITDPERVMQPVSITLPVGHLTIGDMLAGHRPTRNFLRRGRIAEIVVHQDIADSRPRGSIFTKTHNMFGQYNNLPLHNVTVMAGAIYVVRNPLDVVLSVADHFGLSVDDAIEFMGNEETGTPTNEENVAGYMGSWSTHVASWTVQSHPSIVVVRYEDLQDKPNKAFGSVARLLGMDSDRRRVRKAIQFSSFRELKKQELAEGFAEKSPNSRHFFRKGTKNQWAEALSDEQILKIVDRHREQMTRFGYVPPRFKSPRSG